LGGGEGHGWLTLYYIALSTTSCECEDEDVYLKVKLIMFTVKGESIRFADVDLALLARFVFHFL